jgi:hypothetical protein
MRKFWKDLLKERNIAIRVKPALMSQLEIKSIFPLLYKPEECTTNLVKLLNKYDIRFKPNHIYNMPTIRKKIECLANLLIIYHNKTFKQVEEIIAIHSNCKPEDISLNNYFTFNLAILNSVKPPSYKECWLRTNYSNPITRNLLFDLSAMEEDPINELESIYDQWQAHEAAQNQVKEEEKDEIEVIIPDFSSLNPIPKEELEMATATVDPLEPPTLYTSEVPILRTLLLDPTSKYTADNTNNTTVIKWFSGPVINLNSTSTATATTPTATTTTTKMEPGFRSV